MKQTLQEAVYSYEKYLWSKTHLLRDVVSGNLEIFFANKNHHGWSIIWKNTHLEFARSCNRGRRPRQQPQK